MNFRKLFTTLALPLLTSTSFAAPFISIPNPVVKIPSIKIIEVGVNWSSNNNPTYKFTTIGFSKEQSEKIQSSLIYIYHVLSQSRSLANTGPLTDFQQCAVDNTNRFENPNWLGDDLEVRRYASAVVTSLMVLGGGGGVIKAFTETVAKDGSEFVRSGFAPVKTIKAGAAVDISLNTQFLDTYSIAEIASTIFHEFLHNSGWTHPNNGLVSDYPGTFIKEADKCLKSEILKLSSSLGDRPLRNKSRIIMMAD